MFFSVHGVDEIDEDEGKLEKLQINDMKRGGDMGYC